MNGLYRWLSLTLACAGALLGSCSDGNTKKSTPCSRGDLVGCGASCADSRPCPAGLYCSPGGTCDAECTSSSFDCGSGNVCSSDGKCVKRGSNDAGPVGGGADGPSCGEVKLQATPKTPNVLVIVDQSGSMEDPFGTSTRWSVLKESLLADNGLFAELESIVRFGVVLYSGLGIGSTCPALTQVAVARNNLAAIRTVYEPLSPLVDTPTGETIENVLDQIDDGKLVTGKDDPTIFVLATDGEPDTCAAPNPQNGQPEAVAAVKRAFAAGIRTYVIAVAEEDELSQGHLNDMANAGVGTQSGAPSYRVNNDAGLRAALRGIVVGELSCTVPLKGKVRAKDPCVGTVRLEGQALACNSANGWRLVDQSTIEITGSACEGLKTGKLLEATFPCGAAVVF